MEILKGLSQWLAKYASAFIIAVAVITFMVPGLFKWVHGNTQTVILGLIMLTMGLTLTMQDFKVVARRPLGLPGGRCGAVRDYAGRGLSAGEGVASGTGIGLWESCWWAAVRVVFPATSCRIFVMVMWLSRLE